MQRDSLFTQDAELVVRDFHRLLNRLLLPWFCPRTCVGMRLGLYEPCKGLLLAAGQLAAPTPSALPTTSSSPSSATSAPQSAAAAGVGLKVAAGLASGALAAGLTSPTELIKTRLQAKDNTSRGTLEVIRTVVKSDGVQGLWRGAVPSMVRAAAAGYCGRLARGRWHLGRVADSGVGPAVVSSCQRRWMRYRREGVHVTALIPDMQSSCSS